MLFKDPTKIRGHTIFMSGTLGAGKTSFAALYASSLIKRGYTVYSSFHLEGAIPFDISSDFWPKGEKVIVILDEMLRLKFNKFYDLAMLSDGLTMARQYDQCVLWLSQSHLPDIGGLDSTFQIHINTHKIVSLGKWGNINRIRVSSNKFRFNHRISSYGMITFFVFIPSSIWKLYDSKKIFGFTCDKQLRDYTEEEIKRNRIVREAKEKMKKKQLAAEIERVAAELEGAGAVSRVAAGDDQRENTADTELQVPPRLRPKPKWWR